MTELQSTIEFSIELYKFYNVDLFQRGMYQIRCQLRVASKLGSVNIEVTTPECTAGLGSAIVLGSCGACRPFQILYRNEEVTLKDVILFRCHMLVDGNNLRESLARPDFSLVLDLWFSDTSPTNMVLVSTRTLQLNMSPIDGLHYHLPVLFDYFHLSAISVTIHASLTALHQPSLKKGILRYMQSCAPKTSKSWSKTRNHHTNSTNPVLMSVTLSNSYYKPTNHSANQTKSYSSNHRKFNSEMHVEAYNVLLDSTNNLKAIIREYKFLLMQREEIVSDNYDTLVVRHNDYDSTKLLKKQPTSSLAELCTENIKLWNYFLLTFSCKIVIQQHLSRKHHELRIKRFSELFFLIYNPRDTAIGCYETNYQKYLMVAELAKRSKYMQLLPQLPVHCTALDGDNNTMPVIFEDQYQAPDQYQCKKERITSHRYHSTTLAKDIPTTFKRSQTVDIDSKCSCEISTLWGKPQTTLWADPVTLITPKTRHSKSLDQLLHTQTISKSSIRRKNHQIKESVDQTMICDCHLREKSKIQSKNGDVFNSIMNQTRSLNGYNTYQSSSSTNSTETLSVEILETSSSKKFQDKLSKHSTNNTPVRKVRSTSSLTTVPLPNNIPQLTVLSNSESLPTIINNSLNDRLVGSYANVRYKSSSSTSTDDEANSGNSSNPSESVVNSKNGCETNKHVIYDTDIALPPPEQFQDIDSPASISTSDNGNPNLEIPSSIVIDYCFDNSEEDNDDEDQDIIAFDNLLYHVVDRKISIDRPINNFRGIDEFSKAHCDSSLNEEFVMSKPSVAVRNFLKAKREFKCQLNFPNGIFYSDFKQFASTVPYFHISDEFRIYSPEGMHLVICVHGLDGNSADLRLVKTYLELGLPGAYLDFLMSERNQGDTFSNFETMTDRLVNEILQYLEANNIEPNRVSFVGHSLGNIIIRSALTRPQMKFLLPRLHTFLSLSGPHLGTLYNNSGLVNMGMWFMQKWKKSGSLLQLCLKDSSDPRQSFLYKLSQRSTLHHFKNILLCGSAQDRYVPLHSARIELCKDALKDSTELGAIYREMVHNIMTPIIQTKQLRLVRYDVHHALPHTANALIGRAAHIAVLDSEIFIEKFMVIVGIRYFR